MGAALARPEVKLCMGKVQTLASRAAKARDAQAQDPPSNCPSHDKNYEQNQSGLAKGELEKN
jgi:hypothetical protein